MHVRFEKSVLQKSRDRHIWIMLFSQNISDVDVSCPVSVFVFVLRKGENWIEKVCVPHMRRGCLPLQGNQWEESRKRQSHEALLRWKYGVKGTSHADTHFHIFYFKNFKMWTWRNKLNNDLFWVESDQGQTQIFETHQSILTLYS
jgi:hypothetical protein